MRGLHHRARARRRAGAAAVVCVLGALAGCAPTGDTGRWLMKPNRHQAVVLYILPPEEITAIARANGIARADGLALRTDSVCQVFLPPMNSRRHFKLLRHELRHCEQGNWHD